MKTKKSILLAFFLNLAFSVFEFFGGIFTGSVAILSDSVHDLGDAVSIGSSYFFERVSLKKPNEKYTLGYARYSVLGGLITTLILLIGSGIVIYNAILRFINPVAINYQGMLIFAIVGLVINALAFHFTHGGNSINQKAVNLHMLEDLLGWIVVLIGAIIMRFTNFYIIDPILSICLALVIIFNALKNLKSILDLFLFKTPQGISVSKIKEHLSEIDGVIELHHIHLFSTNGTSNYATMHIVVNEVTAKIKSEIKDELNHLGITCSTLELERIGEECLEKDCNIIEHTHTCHHHHH